MYAFYSLLVYIIYTFFRKLPPAGGRDEGPSGSQQEDLSTETEVGAVKPKKEPLWPELEELHSSDDSDGLSGSEDEAGGSGDGPADDLRSPLTEFLALKQEADRSAPAPDSGKASSPLLTVMSHLITFLEHYSHMQRLQGKAEEYRRQLHRQERRRKRQLRNLRDACKQRMSDKITLIHSLESVICEQQGVLQTLQRGAMCPGYPLPTLPAVGVHRLVESISALQGERAQLQEEIGDLRQDMEESERQRRRASGELHQQIEELKEKIRQREEELAQLRAEAGVTDWEKHAQSLSVENEGLKQSLSVTQGLLEKMAAVSAQPSAQLVKENEELRGRVQHLETSLQDKVEQLLYTKGHVDSLQWRREEEKLQLEERIHGLQVSLESERKRAAEVQYVTQTVEVESPELLRSLAQAEERSRTLAEQVCSGGQRCHQLEEQLRQSEDLTALLQSKIVSYEAEIRKLKEQLMQEIHQLEAQKEEAIKEASDCSEQHMDTLRDQLTGVQRRLASLQPVLKTMKTNYNSLRSQVRNFSQFYEASIQEARRQICSAVSSVSDANRDLLQKYQREVQLRKNYHNQLVELKGNIRVLCRVRPHTEEGGAIVTDANDDTKMSVTHKGKERSFQLDKVFLPEATQEEVFLEIEPVVTSCINGFHVCIFAYGQTGSGKTYTMEGTSDKPGMGLQSLRALYQEMEARRGLWSYDVTLSMVEIYNEVIRDLLARDPQEKLDIKLNPDGSGQLHVPGLTCKEVKSFRHIKKRPPKEKLDIKLNPDGSGQLHVPGLTCKEVKSFHHIKKTPPKDVPGLTSKEVKSFHHIKKLLSLGKRTRATFCTNMNERSSRSHALLTVTIRGQELSTGALTTGKLHLVDLAGSERVSKSGAEGERLKEAQNINRSLLALGEVIQALRAKQTHVPFRNSKLTYLLQDSLGKGNKTVMMVQVSPLEENVGETICSLNFAQRVCKVELGPASRKIDTTTAKAEI